MRFLNGLPAIHPGEFLAEILEGLHLKPAVLARKLGVSAMRISHLLKGKRPITTELAFLLSRAFDQTPQYWLNLQMDYNLKTIAPHMAERIQHIQPLNL